MLEWLSNNWSGLLVGVGLLAVVIFAVVSLVKGKKKTGCSCGCGCGCDGCHEECH